MASWLPPFPVNGSIVQAPDGENVQPLTQAPNAVNNSVVSNPASPGTGFSLNNLEIWVQSEAFNLMILLLFVVVFGILLYALVSDQNPVEIVQTASKAGAGAVKDAAIASLA